MPNSRIQRHCVPTQPNRHAKQQQGMGANVGSTSTQRAAGLHGDTWESQHVKKFGVCGRHLCFSFLGGGASSPQNGSRVNRHIPQHWLPIHTNKHAGQPYPAALLLTQPSTFQAATSGTLGNNSIKQACQTARFPQQCVGPLQVVPPPSGTKGQRYRAGGEYGRIGLAVRGRSGEHAGSRPGAGLG